MHSPAYSTVIPFYFTYISYTCICTPRPSAHIHLPYPLALTVCIPRFSSTSCQFPTFCLSTPSTSPTLNLVYLHVILPTTLGRTFPYRYSHVPFTSSSPLSRTATFHSQSFSLTIQYQHSTHLTPHPPTLHPITRAGTTNTASISRFTSPVIPLTHVDTSIPPPTYMRRHTQHLYHKQTICLQVPYPNCDLAHLYLNDEILNHILQILHWHSLYRTTRHFLPTFFLNMITSSTSNLYRIHQRQLESPGGPRLGHTYLLIPFNITPVYWTLVVYRADTVHGATTVSHDSLPMSVDITAAEQYMRHYNKILKLSPGFTSSPIHHVSAVKQNDAYNCGVYVLTTAIVYLYHPDPCAVPWHSLNYPPAALHMRNIIIAILQTGHASVLTHAPIKPLPPLTYAHNSRIPACLHDTHDQPPAPAPEPHQHPYSTTKLDTHARKMPTGGASPYHTVPVQCTQPDNLFLKKIATWNLNRQSLYDESISTCMHGHIYLLHCTEPAAFLSIKGSPASSTLICTTDKSGCAVYITQHSHTYIRQTTFLTRLITQRSSHADRLHVFTFKGDNGDHTTVIGLYTFQRGHKTHGTSIHTPPVTPPPPLHHNNPKHLKHALLALINDFKTVYQQLTLLTIGDVQHTVRNNTLRRIGHPQPPPPANILAPCLHSLLHLVSVILTQRSNGPYYTWYIHSGKGQAGLDHILAIPEHIHSNCFSGIDREISRA